MLFPKKKKKANDDGEVFQLSGSAPASQTSVVVDDAWPSEKKKRSKTEMRWSPEPKSKPKEIKV